MNHPVIANDAAMSFNRRVVPGNVGASFLHERLTVEIPNTSGMMPLEVDEDSDYDERRDEYIAAITAWIETGAPDLNGNTAPAEGASLPPQIHALWPSGHPLRSVRAGGRGWYPAGGGRPIVVTVFIVDR